MEGDNRTFRVDFTSEGVSKLRDVVKDKLKELMGDYTDDTLVEYVIVLLKNGRSKDEAKSELNVFLGDDSDSFVSWLWKHLGSDISLYVQPQEFQQDGMPNKKLVAGDDTGKTVNRGIKSKVEKANFIKLDGQHKDRIPKGLLSDRDGNEVLPQTSVDGNEISNDKPYGKLRRTKSLLAPRSTVSKKRKQTEEQKPRKRDVFKSIVGAPRRLLQFAVRDAIGPSRPSNVAEPARKRLRSMVSTSKDDLLQEERPQRIPRNLTPVAIKASTDDAIENVSQTRPSRNVFDRLGDTSNALNTAYHQENECAAEVLGDDMNTRNAQHQEEMVVPEMGNHKRALRSMVAAKPKIRPMKEKIDPISTSNGNAKLDLTQQLPEKTRALSGLQNAGVPTGDADSRTIFLSNVHFAATKDSLSQHFKRFGEVLKVIILTDPPTGQPKGSAYIEFLRKETAELALSLDGTSFMSRLLKIVKKSSAKAQPEAASISKWPHIAQASPLFLTKLGRFHRGMPGLYRGRAPTKPWARSFQWKRGAASTADNTSAGTSFPAPALRGLTYVRTETKANGSSGTA